MELLHARLGNLFKRPQPHQHSLGYMKGLLSPIKCKTRWQLAQWMGESTLDGVQHLIERASWEADVTRDMLRNYVVERLGDREGVLIVAETGFIKKSAGDRGLRRGDGGQRHGAGPRRAAAALRTGHRRDPSRRTLATGG